MNSLTELNGHGLNNIAYTDTRDPSVAFQNGSATNPTIYINQGQPFYASYGNNIVEIINYPVCNVCYIIDLSSANDGVTVTWTNFPSHCSITNPSSKIWKVSGIQSAADWELIRNPTIQLPDEEATTLIYNSSITYLTSSVMSWTNTVNITPYDVFNIPVDYDYPNGVSAVVYPYVKVYDTTTNNIIWTVSVTPSSPSSVNIMFTTGTGGTSSFNATTKVLTIIGTRTQVNSHLTSLYFTGIQDSTTNFSMAYRATNNTDSRDKTVTQNFIAEFVKYLGLIGGTVNYTEDTAITLVNYPVITDLQNINGTFLYSITANPIGSVRSMSNTGSGGVVTYDDITKTLLFTGNKSQINGRLASTSIIPASDYDQSFSLVYHLVTPDSHTNTKSQTVNCAVSHTEVSNMAVTRRYTGNVSGDALFSTNTPQITDLDPYATDYTITLSSPVGKFGLTSGNAVSTYTYTGTKSQINSLFSTIKFFNFILKRI